MPLRLEDLEYSEDKPYNKLAVYARTKTANILFTNEIAKRAKAKNVPILAYSVHPGCKSQYLSKCLYFVLNEFLD